MNLFKNLANIYDELTKTGDYPSGLLPIGYSTAEIPLEIHINEKSEFVSATFIEKTKYDSDTTTLIPITEISQSRTNSPSPHMLCDDLRYVAGDIVNYLDNTKKEKNKIYFDLYNKQLEEFIKSKYTTKNIKILYKYINKKCLAKDLIENNILILDETGFLLENPTKEQKEEHIIFKHIKDEQIKIMTRFVIDTENGKNILFHKDNETIKAFSEYYINLNNSGSDIDYTTGMIGKSGEIFPKKIRSTGDGTKLFSSNDTGSFTFRGIYDKANEARLINQINSDKAHNALKYLIKKQGIYINGKEILIFGNVNFDFNPINDDFDDFFEEDDINYDSYEDYAKSVKKALLGYNKKIEIDENSYITILILDSMVPGRLSVNYYKEYYGTGITDFIDNIQNWYINTSWDMSYFDKIEKEYKHYYGNYNLRRIVEYTFGIETEKGFSGDKKVIDKNIVSLMLAIFNDEKINYSLIKQINYRAKTPLKYKQNYNYTKVLKTACQLNRKYYNDKNKKEVIPVELSNNKEINYQLGRLLAVMELIETSVNREHSQPNAKLYFEKYFNNPMKTYEIIYKKVLTYEKKLKSNYLIQLRQEIISNIDPEEFKNIKKLDGRALCGYDAQISDYYKKLKNNKEENKED